MIVHVHCAGLESLPPTCASAGSRARAPALRFVIEARPVYFSRGHLLHVSFPAVRGEGRGYTAVPELGLGLGLGSGLGVRVRVRVRVRGTLYLGLVHSGE